MYDDWSALFMSSECLYSTFAVGTLGSRLWEEFVFEHHRSDFGPICTGWPALMTTPGVLSVAIIAAAAPMVRWCGWNEPSVNDAGGPCTLCRTLSIVQ